MSALRFGLALLLSLSFAAARGAEPVPAGPPVPPGTVFHFAGMVYLAGRIEFRDPTRELWPNYWYEGKWGDVRGKLVFDPQAPQLQFILTCTRLVNPNDGMDLKVLGEVMKKESVPPVRFTLNKMGAWDAPSADRKTAAFQSAPAEGELDVDGRKVHIRGRAEVRYNTPKGGDLRGLAANSLLGVSVNVTVDFSIKGRDLGLKKVADKEIQVKVYSRAYTEATILENRKAKTLKDAGVKE